MASPAGSARQALGPRRSPPSRMQTEIAPSTGRRKVLKLLAGSVAGAGLGSFRADVGFAAEAPVRVADGVMGLELDSLLRSRVVVRQGDAFEPLTDFESSETLRLADGRRIERFPFLDQRSEQVEDQHGRGTRHVLR